MFSANKRKIIYNNEDNNIIFYEKKLKTLKFYTISCGRNSKNALIFTGSDKDDLYSFDEIETLRSLGINGEKNALTNLKKHNKFKSSYRIITLNDNQKCLAIVNFIFQLTFAENKNKNLQTIELLYK